MRKRILVYVLVSLAVVLFCSTTLIAIRNLQEEVAMLEEIREQQTQNTIAIEELQAMMEEK